MPRPRNKNTNNSALGFETTLWATADKLRGNLGVIDLVSAIDFVCGPGAPTQRDSAAIETAGEGSGPIGHYSKDVIGCVHEYFLSEFAGAEGKKGGQLNCEFRSANVEFRMAVSLDTRNSSFDISPGGRFVQSVEFVKAHLALRGIGADFGPEHADTYRSDLRADNVLASPTRICGSRNNRQRGILRTQ